MKLPTQPHRDLLAACLGYSPDIIATVDHVFSSPPLRLVDSHRRLATESSVLLLLYDVTGPSIKKYRSDLILDTGFLTSREQRFHLYDTGKLYALAATRKPDLAGMAECLSVILPRLNGFTRASQHTFESRLNNLFDTYRAGGFVPGSLATEYYLKLLPRLYTLCGWASLARFVSENLTSYYSGPLLRKYIPALIELTMDEPYGLPALSAMHLFNRRLFRSASAETELTAAQNDAREGPLLCKNLCIAIAHGALIPSIEVCSWAIALAGVAHFGNDFGFIERLSCVLTDSGVYNTIAACQVTRHGGDGAAFAKYDHTFGHRVTYDGGKVRIARSPIKRSRYSSITSTYLHLGATGIQSALNEYVLRSVPPVYDARVVYP